MNAIRLNTCREFPIGKDKLNVYIPASYRKTYQEIHQLSQRFNTSISQVIGLGLKHFLECDKIEIIDDHQQEVREAIPPTGVSA